MRHTNLEMVKRCRDLMMEIYTLTLQLSGFQRFDEDKSAGQPITSAGSAMLKAPGKKRYNYEFFKFLVDSQASEDLNIDSMEPLFEKGSLTDEKFYEALKTRFECLVSILKGFKQSEDEFLPAQ